jgi:hypothetical protein
MGRKRKYSSSTVISIRISDEELEDITRIMADNRISRVSDVMREAIKVFKSSLPIEMQRAARCTCQTLYGNAS